MSILSLSLYIYVLMMMYSLIHVFHMLMDDVLLIY